MTTVSHFLKAGAVPHRCFNPKAHLAFGEGAGYDRKGSESGTFKQLGCQLYLNRKWDSPELYCFVHIRRYLTLCDTAGCHPLEISSQ